MKTLQDVQTGRGIKMVDADGGKIGTIEDIFLDRHTGEPAWAAVKPGLFGHRQTFVPIRDAEVTGDNEVRVGLQKEKVKGAPRVDAKGELTPEEERKLWEYYGLSDYDDWQGDDRTRALALPDEDEDRARRSATDTEAGGGAPAIVGVRLRRVVVVTVPAGEREPGQNGNAASSRGRARGAFPPGKTDRHRSGRGSLRSNVSDPDETHGDVGELGKPAPIEDMRHHFDDEALGRAPERDPANQEDPLGQARDEHLIGRPVHGRGGHHADQEDRNPDPGRHLLLAGERVDATQRARGLAQARPDRLSHRVLVSARLIRLRYVDGQMRGLGVPDALPFVEEMPAGVTGQGALGHGPRVEVPEELVDRGETDREFGGGGSRVGHREASFGIRDRFTCFRVESRPGAGKSTTKG
jgi:hypothetical protein